MSFTTRDLETVLAELAEAEERVANLARAVAEGRIAPSRLDLAVYLRDGLRRQVAELDGRSADAT